MSRLGVNELERIRQDFPILSRRVGAMEAPVVYLDSAATNLVPIQVIQAVDDYLFTSKANVHREAHFLAEETTDVYEGTRHSLSDWLKSPSPDNILLTHGTTESLNCVALAWGANNLTLKDTVALSIDNHHSGIIPWQMLSQRIGFDICYVHIDDQGYYDMDSLSRALCKKPRLFCLPLISNVLGYIQPNLSLICREAKQLGSMLVIDAAQGAMVLPDAIPSYKPDFMAFSAHKMHGYGGLGVLYCSDEALGSMRPCFGGGGMVDRVTLTGYLPTSGPSAYEAGTPAIEATVALAAAIKYLQGHSIGSIREHVARLSSLALSELCAIPGLEVLGSREAERVSLISFTIPGIHPHDVSHCLSERGIAVRAGHQCAMPLHDALGQKASVRASFSLFNTVEDVHELVAGLRSAVEVYGR